MNESEVQSDYGSYNLRMSAQSGVHSVPIVETASLNASLISKKSSNNTPYFLPSPSAADQLKNQLHQ